MTRERVWPYLIAALAAASAMLVGLDVHTPVRAPVTIAFLVVCPGMALIRRLRLDPWPELLIAVVVSLCVSAALASVSIYLGVWNPSWVLLVIVAVSCVATAFDLVTGPPAET